LEIFGQHIGCLASQPQSFVWAVLMLLLVYRKCFFDIWRISGLVLRQLRPIPPTWKFCDVEDQFLIRVRSMSSLIIPCLYWLQEFYFVHVWDENSICSQVHHLLYACNCSQALSVVKFALCHFMCSLSICDYMRVTNIVILDMVFKFRGISSPTTVRLYFDYRHFFRTMALFRESCTSHVINATRLRFALMVLDCFAPLDCGFAIRSSLQDYGHTLLLSAWLWINPQTFCNFLRPFRISGFFLVH
jgi:hypothetical protein